MIRQEAKPLDQPSNFMNFRSLPPLQFGFWTTVGKEITTLGNAYYPELYDYVNTVQANRKNRCSRRPSAALGSGNSRDLFLRPVLEWRGPTNS